MHSVPINSTTLNRPAADNEIWLDGWTMAHIKSRFDNTEKAMSGVWMLGKNNIYIFRYLPIGMSGVKNASREVLYSLASHQNGKKSLGNLSSSWTRGVKASSAF